MITTLGVTRLDMDVESNSLNNTAGITRRNQAIALTEQWAAANGIPLQIQYTIPVEQYGLDPNGEAVLQNAVTEGATVNSVNIMVFDYYIAKEGVVEMGTAAENAANNTHTQLQSIFPSLTSAQIWHMEGMTMLPGIDDLRKKTEVTYEPDATTMLHFRPGQQHELPVDLGDPARQRRLPRHRRQQYLLGHHPEHLGLQPPARALHQLGSDSPHERRALMRTHGPGRIDRPGPARGAESGESDPGYGLADRYWAGARYRVRGDPGQGSGR